MRAFDRIRHFFRNVFAGGSADRDLDEEIRHHIELEVEDGVRSGLSEAEARRRALLAFGGVERHREAARDQRGTFLLEEIRRDIGLALRGMRRNPGFATVAILTLALGIGANAAIFSVVNGVLLRPAPFPDADRLAMVWETDRSSNTAREPSSIPDFADFQARSQQFTQLAALTPREVNVTLASGDPTRVASLAV
ncbi:MAG TPA: permease prefix domain 1-containing protein, partial [Longimicrobiales bacterium]|nr:permease prefix domain 1-containing protein [Longimicrobiales bacterium]